MAQDISLMTLFDLGTHRGNSKSKLNPKLKSRVFGYSNDLCIIDLVKTIKSIGDVSNFLSFLGERRKQVLVVGTSDHIAPIVPETANQFSNGLMPYVDYRWLGGTLTNWSTIKKTLKTLEKLESISSNEEFFNKLSRNEQLNILKKQQKISKFFSGLRTLRNNRPGAILVLDGPSNPIAIKEAEAVKVPVITLTGTNIKTLPTDISKTIVCNINSTNAVKFLIHKLVSSYNHGVDIGIEKRNQQVAESKKEEKK